MYLRYTDLTAGVQAFTTEGWVSLSTGSDDEAWIPLMIRRQSSDALLASTFIAVMTPYQGELKVAGIRRLRLETEANVAIEIQFIDGRKNLFFALDVENPLGLIPLTGNSPNCYPARMGNASKWRVVLDTSKP